MYFKHITLGSPEDRPRQFARQGGPESAAELILGIISGEVLGVLTHDRCVAKCGTTPHSHMAPPATAPKSLLRQCLGYMAKVLVDGAEQAGILGLRCRTTKPWDVPPGTVDRELVAEVIPPEFWHGATPEILSALCEEVMEQVNYVTIIASTWPGLNWPIHARVSRHCTMRYVLRIIGSKCMQPPHKLSVVKISSHNIATIPTQGAPGNIIDAFRVYSAIYTGHSGSSNTQVQCKLTQSVNLDRRVSDYADISQRLVVVEFSLGSIA